MHPEYNAGNSDTNRNEEQTDHQGGIKQPERHCIANAVIESPEGRENWEGGSRLGQQCGSSAQGRFLHVLRLTTRNSATPAPTAKAAAATAAKRSGPPNSKIANAIGYHSHPSPPRVAQIIHRRTHLGARHLWTRRMSR